MKFFEYLFLACLYRHLPHVYFQLPLAISLWFLCQVQFILWLQLEQHRTSVGLSGLVNMLVSPMFYAGTFHSASWLVSGSTTGLEPDLVRVCIVDTSKTLRLSSPMS
jgi:hypothetical protein